MKNIIDFFGNHKNKIVVLVLLLTNLMFLGYIYFQNRPETIKNFKNPYPYLDPARSFIEQKYFFSTIEPVRRQMKETVEKYSANGNKIGVYFEYLNTGANVSINQEERFWPASLSKMPTAFAVMKKVEKGEWKLSNELVLLADDKDERFGDLYKQSVGTRFTIEELLRQSLTNSDNTAHKILVRNLKSEDYTDIFEALGVEELYDKNYDITAKEYSRIFRSLYSASYLNRQHSEDLLKWLSQTNFNEFLGTGVPSGIGFSHKIGEEYEQVVFLDSGIVYIPNKPYLITVMVKVGDGGGDARAKEIMGELSREAYNYVSSN